MAVYFDCTISPEYCAIGAKGYLDSVGVIREKKATWLVFHEPAKFIISEAMNSVRDAGQCNPRPTWLVATPDPNARNIISCPVFFQGLSPVKCMSADWDMSLKHFFDVLSKKYGHDIFDKLGLVHLVKFKARRKW